MNIIGMLFAVPIIGRFLREVWSVLSDFVLIEGEDPRCLAPELDNACGF